MELFDLVARHVAKADALPGVRARVGDARGLPVEDGSADPVLLPGPLHHLGLRADRVATLRRTASEPALLGVSDHLLTVGHRPRAG
ncbi:class I SAM-dependent methyltransferase [Streptomyces sp. NPDC049954]|uniref:class I SAM-dependent methyltransferase n=1 Tax=Streptomyces sp. NPDC049954 TaxID=3155779 RepID=UPI0034205ED6